MKRYLIVISIIILIVTLAIIIKVEKQKTYDEIRKEDNIVFLGDSIMDWYPISDIYGTLPIVKSGIAGYETDDILSRLDDMVYKYNPTKVFLLIGTNDLKTDEDKTKETANNIIEIMNNIKAKRPMTKLYFQSIYPVNRNMSGAEERYNDEIKDVNRIVKEYCDKNNVTYINMFDELTDDKGNFKESLTRDGLHPNDLGYARISQVLLRYIYEKE